MVLLSLDFFVPYNMVSGLIDWAIDCSIWLKCDTSLSMLSIEQYCKVLKVLSVLGCQSKKEHLGTFPYPASNETW